MSRWKAAVIPALVGSALAVLTGCSSTPGNGVACAAIGYVEGVRISVVPAKSPSPDLQACVETLCSPVIRAGQPVVKWSGTEPARLRLDNTGGNAWFLTLDMNPRPQRVTLHLYRQGHLEQSQQVLTRWHRASPGDVCDLHQITPPVTVTER